jgi:hypothetical protein
MLIPPGYEPGAHPLLLGPEDGGGLGARGCLPRGCCDEVRQDQGGGDGDEDRGERDGWLGQHAELGDASVMRK